MNVRERFHAVMNYGEVDRLPVYFFGTWPETKVRWVEEGFDGSVKHGSSGGPQLASMDTDWEMNPCGTGQIWDNQGLLRAGPIGDLESTVLEETDDCRVVRTSLGGVVKHGKHGSSIPQHLEPDLKPTRTDWERFKSYLNPGDECRWLDGWQERAENLRQRDHATCFLAGSLFGHLRDWLGVEAMSYLPYDDPQLYAEMIGFMADFSIRLNTQLLRHIDFDFAYFHEDCCFNTGPLLSPKLYREFYHQHYVRMIAAYRELGVPWMLMDSDGKVDDLLPLWLESGFDILFPVEVGTWKANPVTFRRQYGKRLRMMGGVDKHVISEGEAAIRAELEPLRELAADGGFIPLPDHRIPPNVSLDQMEQYVRIYKEVFAGVPAVVQPKEVARPPFPAGDRHA